MGKSTLISRVSSILLALALIFIMLPWQVMADDGDGVDAPEVNENVTALSLTITENDGELTLTKPDGASFATASRLSNGVVRIHIGASDGVAYDLTNLPISINGKDVRKYKDNLLFVIVNVGSDDETNVSNFELRIYPDLWSELSGTPSDGETQDDEDNAKGDDPKKYDPTEYESVYASDEIKVNDIPVIFEFRTPVTSPVVFNVFNSTKQELTTVESNDGYIKELKLIKGDRYYVYTDDVNYYLDSMYFDVTEEGVLHDYKWDYEIEEIDLMDRNTYYLENPEAGNRALLRLPVKYKGKDLVSGVKFTLTSDQETITAVSDEDGFLITYLIEDINYMVEVDSDKYAIDAFPLTIKDKTEYSEDGSPIKLPFDHFSCTNVQHLSLIDKADAHKNDSTAYSYDGNVSLTGVNFKKEPKYALSERILENVKVDKLEGKDCEVVDIDTINMERFEISKLAKGDFKVTRKVPAGKNVKQVYYINENGDLVKVNFKQNTLEDGSSTVTFDMPNMSMYNNVIEYGEAEAETVEYYFANGANARWKQGDGALKFVVKEKTNDALTFDRFKGIEIDGMAVNEDNFEATKGSVNISLNKDYLETLKPGKHTLKANFEDGSVATDFTVSVADSAQTDNANGGSNTADVTKSVATGDDMNVVVFAVMLSVAIVALVTILFWRKREN